MKIKKLFAFLLCVCLLPVCAASAEDEITLSVAGWHVSAAPDATEVDLGVMALPDNDEAYEALEAFIQQLPSLEKLDMFSTDIPVNRVLYLGNPEILPGSAGAGPGSQQLH